MLVLSRKVGEQLIIGDNIRVVIHRVAGNRVTVGIEAPNDVRIVRGELTLHEEDVDHGFQNNFAGGAPVAILPRRK